MSGFLSSSKRGVVVLYGHQAPNVELPRADLPARDAAVPSTWSTWYDRYLVPSSRWVVFYAHRDGLESIANVDD